VCCAFEIVDDTNSKPMTAAEAPALARKKFEYESNTFPVCAFRVPLGVATHCAPLDVYAPRYMPRVERLRRAVLDDPD